MATQSFFEIIPNNKNIDFVKLARTILPAAFAVIVLALILSIVKGFNYGVDFKGGTEIHLKFSDATDDGAIRARLEKLGVKDSTVQEYGEAKGKEFLIHVLPEDLSLSKYQASFEKALNPIETPGKSVKLRLSEDRIYAIFDQTVASDQKFKKPCLKFQRVISKLNRLRVLEMQTITNMSCSFRE